MTLFVRGGGGRDSLAATSLEHDIDGTRLYFELSCQPASRTTEQVCDDITRSIGWSAPLFAGLRSDTAVVRLG